MLLARVRTNQGSVVTQEHVDSSIHFSQKMLYRQKLIQCLVSRSAEHAKLCPQLLYKHFEEPLSLNSAMLLWFYTQLQPAPAFWGSQKETESFQTFVSL